MFHMLIFKNVFDINKRKSDIWKQCFVTVGDKITQKSWSSFLYALYYFISLACYHFIVVFSFFKIFLFKTLTIMWLSWDFLNLKCRMNCMKTLNDTPRIEVWKRCILHEIHTNMIKIDNRQEIVLVTVCLLFECIDGKLWCNAPSFNQVRKVLFKESA